MHFAYLTEADPSINYGRGINEREFIREVLDRHGDEVTCIVPAPAEPDNFADSRLEYVSSHRHSGIQYPFYLLSTWRRILQLHQEDELDALVVRLDVTPLIPYMARKFLRVPIILKTLVSRQSFGQKVTGPPGPQDVAKRVFQGMFRNVINGSIAADTVSETLADGLRSEFDLKDRLQVIPNGANLELFRPGSQKEARRDLGLESFDFLVGYTGAITEVRHLDVLLRAFKSQTKDKNIGLVIVGEGKGKEALEDECQRLGIRDQVFFPGWVPYERVPRILQALDVAVDLSRVPLRYGGEEHFATYSQKLAQYLGVGVPVLAWKLRDTAFLERENIGAVAPFKDVDELSRRLSGLLSGRSDRKRRRLKARRFAEENLSNSVLVDRRLAFWRSAVSRWEATSKTTRR